jgi:hypothetical protein
MHIDRASWTRNRLTARHHQQLVEAEQKHQLLVLTYPRLRSLQRLLASDVLHAQPLP